jgi:CHAP domain
MEHHKPIPEPTPEDFATAQEVSETEERDLEQGEQKRSVEAASLGLRMVLQAVTQLKPRVCETGHNGGTPHERYVKRFWPKSGPEPWCAFFVSWCYLKVTGRQPPWDNKGAVASVNSWASRANALVRSPLQGDMFGTSNTHMGMVRGVRDDGQIVTIEGNTSSGCVKSNIRPVRGLWFARPR